MAILFAPVNFSVVRAVRWDDDVLLVDKLTQLPVSLSGITRLVMRVRADANTSIICEMTTTAGTLSILDAANGRVGIRCSSTFMQAFPLAGNDVESYVYDMLIERTAGEYEPAISGTIVVFPQVTRAYGST